MYKDGNPISGANGSIYYIPSVTETACYYVIATNIHGSITSDTATITCLVIKYFQHDNGIYGKVIGTVDRALFRACWGNRFTVTTSTKYCKIYKFRFVFKSMKGVALGDIMRVYMYTLPKDNDINNSTHRVKVYDANHVVTDLDSTITKYITIK